MNTTWDGWVQRSTIAALLLCVFLGVHSLLGQDGHPLPPHAIKRLYVEPFQGANGPEQLRAEVVARLRADRKWEVVERPAEADAIVRGNGETWVKGYVLTNPRSKSWRQPDYGGYLSLEIQNKTGETLWSYLVTPGRLHWNGAARDMADHIVQLMDTALAEANISNPHSGRREVNELSIEGAGSTFAAPLYEEWIESFEAQRSGAHVVYHAVGSEKGIQDLKQSKADFAASDVPLSDAQTASTQMKVDEYATVLGGVVVAYNLAGIGQDLKFTPEVLADIYLGKITRWNDRRLREFNRGANLPDQPIVVVHRSDGSGTSFAWTEFLSKTRGEWKNSVGTGMNVRWPTGEGVEGNEGVALKVSQTPWAIGYMELTYALRHQLSFGMVRNAAGSFVQANLMTLGNAAKSVPQSGDLRASLTDTHGKDAYPIATFTWIIIPKSAESAQRLSVLRDMIRWMLTSGQKECAGLGYLPLPKEIADAELHQLAHLVTNPSVPQ